MKNNKVIMYSLLAIVIVATGILLFSIYNTDELPSNSEYLSFFPSEPLILVETEGLKKMPKAVKNLEIFDVSEKVGLQEEISSQFGELLDDKATVSSARQALKKISGFTTGEFSAGLFQGTDNNLQLLAVFPIADTPGISEENLRPDDRQISKFIRDRWLEKIDDKIIYDTGSFDGLTIHTFKGEESPGVLQFSLVEHPDYLLVGVGRSVLPEALQRFGTASRNYSILNDHHSPEIGVVFEQRFFEALVSQVENVVGQELEGVISFSGLREAFSELFGGLEPLHANIYFRDKSVIVDSKLKYELKDLHPLAEYFLSHEPVTFQGPQFFDKNTVSLAIMRLPETDKLYRRFIEALVYIVNSGADEEVNSRVDQTMSFFRMFLPEQNIENLLGTIKGEIAFGTTLSPVQDSGDIPLASLRGSSLVAIELTDYAEFVSALEEFNTFDFFDFNRSNGHLQVADDYLELFIENYENWVLIANNRETVQQAGRAYNSGDNLENYERYREVREHHPEQLNELGYYNLAPYGEMLKEGSFAGTVPAELQEFYSRLEPKLAELARELLPATVVTINDPGDGCSRTTLVSPGGPIFISGLLNALPELAEKYDDFEKSDSE